MEQEERMDCLYYIHIQVGRDSSVGIVTRYLLGGLRIESRFGRNFAHLTRPNLGTTQLSIQRAPSLSGGKSARAWR
jgi:hypothetical protein